MAPIAAFGAQSHSRPSSAAPAAVSSSFAVPRSGAGTAQSAVRRRLPQLDARARLQAELDKDNLESILTRCFSDPLIAKTCARTLKCQDITLERLETDFDFWFTVESKLDKWIKAGPFVRLMREIKTREDTHEQISVLDGDVVDITVKFEARAAGK